MSRATVIHRGVGGRNILDAVGKVSSNVSTVASTHIGRVGVHYSWRVLGNDMACTGICKRRMRHFHYMKERHVDGKTVQRNLYLQ